MNDRLKHGIAGSIDGTLRLEPMRAAFRSVIEKQVRNAGRMGDLDARLERLRATRESSVGDRALYDRAVANLEANRFRVRAASGAAEAIEMVRTEMGAEKLLVKSKSNLSKEIGLAHALGDAGIEVIETDIGDRVNQIGAEPSVHPTGPCAHLDRHRIARILSDHLGREIDPEPHALIEAVRDDVTPSIARARVGLTGVNAVAADEGALLWCHNEGNLDLVTQRPGKLIVLAAPEKVYPNLEEALNMVELETYFATGQPVTSFIRVVSGPSKTADIEKELYYGVHGPGEIVVIMVDNGRWKLLEDEDLRETLRCIGCGACLLECPAYDIVGPCFGSEGLLGGRGVCAIAATDGLGSAVDGGLPLCTTCRSCVERCPLAIAIPDLIETIRARATDLGLLPLDEHVPMAAGIRNYGNPWMQPRRARDRWTRGLVTAPEKGGDTAFFAGCSLAYLFPGTAAAAVRALRNAGAAPVTLGGKEVCCGSPLLRIGQRDLFLESAEANVAAFQAAGVKEVVTSCPGCLKALREYREFVAGFDLPVRHITQVLAEAVAEGRLAPGGTRATTVTYHDPCHLGRGCGIYDEPRKVIESVEGVRLVEMERTREASACCGAGGGVWTAFPELSRQIGRKRASMAESTGADLLVTSCPWCRQNLSEFIQVIDVLDLLEKAE